uniref:NTR domain-containing protein n=1 Tax=Panagrolaimus sp. PS1159 TaxID=55785 RepID=A0AC35FMV8_9BILA
MKILIFFIGFICISEACKCQEQKAKEAFCKAHWVAHAKVQIRQTKTKMPENPSRPGLNNIRYNVEYGKIYKSPADLKGELPKEIYTPSERPACGLLIDAGKEYLLAGRYENGTMTTVLCGQILSDDSNKETFESVLEWKNVPKTLQNRLDIKAFEPCN